MTASGTPAVIDMIIVELQIVPSAKPYSSSSIHQTPPVQQRVFLRAAIKERLDTAPWYGDDDVATTDEWDSDRFVKRLHAGGHRSQHTAASGGQPAVVVFLQLYDNLRGRVVRRC